MSDDLEASVQRRLAEMVEHEFERGLFGDTCTATAGQALPALNVEKFIGEMSNLLAQFRRTDLTMTVSMSHLGPITKHEHPTDGTFIEMNFRDAQRLHARCPLVMRKVIDRDTAEFTFASPLHGWIPEILQMPPYELPDEDGPSQPPAPPVAGKE